MTNGHSSRCSSARSDATTNIGGCCSPRYNKWLPDGCRYTSYDNSDWWCCDCSLACWMPMLMSCYRWQRPSPMRIRQPAETSGPSLKGKYAKPSSTSVPTKRCWRLEPSSVAQLQQLVLYIRSLLPFCKTSLGI